MHCVPLLLSESNAASNEYMQGFLHEIAELAKHPAKIYRTSTHDDEFHFEFRTPSKDVCLKLCSLDSNALYHFARLLEREFKKKICAELLVYKENKETKEVEKGALLVTINRDLGGYITYTCSPAHG